MPEYFFRDFNRGVLNFLPIILLVVCTNFFIDPANIFKNRKYEKDIIATLKSGKNAAFAVTMSQVDEVAFLESLNEYIFSPLDVLVFGSSRAFSISSEIFPNTRFFNASISSLKLGDLLGLYKKYEDRNIVVKNLIISLDPDLLVMDFMPKNSLYFDFMKMSHEIGVVFDWREIFDLYSQLIRIKLLKFIETFSPSYFQDSLRFMVIKQFGYMGLSLNDQNINLNKQTWYPTNDRVAMGGVIFPDGSREWWYKLLVASDTEKTEYIKQCSVDMERIKQKKNFINYKSRMIFEKYIKYLKTKNINVVFYFPPYHPITYNYETRLNPNSAVLLSESYFRAFALENKIPMFGSFDPKMADINAEDMVDHHHPKRSTAAKILLSLA